MKKILVKLTAWRFYVPFRVGLIVCVLGLSLLVCITIDLRQAEARYASIVIDADTGEVLRSRNADTRNYPASQTK